jgi:hypothetical protein
MSDEPFYAPNRKPNPAPAELKPGERLFVFVKALSGERMACDLIFQGESYGWEARFTDRTGVVFSRGAFAMKAAAVQWTEEQRKALARS